MKKCFYWMLLIGITSSNFGFSQMRRPPSKIHLSLVPGFSNHGVDEIRNSYNLSLNLTSGVSGRVNGFEMSMISNYNFVRFQGIQLAGVANISGVNNNINKKEQLDETFLGIQFSGLINKTLSNGVGAQLSSINIVGGEFSGLQLGALVNKTHSLMGIQIAGLINSATDGISGIQAASLINYSGGQSNGIQLALFNYCRTAGYQSNQKGLFGDFYQIGLINISKTNNGNQIGLINITGKNNGVPLGILNLDASHGYVSFRADDVFLTSMVISTGSQYYQNTFKIGYNYAINSMPVWGISYGLEKEWMEQSLTPSWICDMGFHFIQLKEKDKALFKGNKLLRAEAIYARKIGKGKFFEMGIAINYQLNSLVESETNLLNIEGSRIQPGLILGIRT